METLKKRPIAILLALVIVAGSTFLSVSIKLGRECQKITDGFYSGVTYAGYEHPSVQSQLKNISGAALGVATLAANYTGIDASAVKQDCTDLNSSLENGSVGEIYDRYSLLTADTTALIADMRRQPLSDRDASGVTQYEGIISSAVGVIDKSGYNDTVRDFMRDTYNLFPASMFAGVAGVKSPELFE